MSRSIHAMLAVLLASTLAACSSAPPLSEEDEEALATLAAVAGPTSNVDPEAITRTECWLPSDHPIEDESVSDTSWRVLCRAHYVDDSGDRYQDATCVGDFAAEPMLEHCYRWAYYTGMPMFEDFPAVAAD
ncbi:hypothetical protein ELQ92_13880 [Labedella populi]|uniref:Uncharacterized protein n=1 Tax=Labedella populi TaxID=2498850 RepID=A0A3S4BYM6_9MICO|nr:hypothetical protein [Labedella populi]RWZ59337.1 hypothetical protein ELQ92_13880 [Labedella populi]